jgi:hypothetical protein
LIQKVHINTYSNKEDTTSQINLLIQKVHINTYSNNVSVKLMFEYQTTSTVLIRFRKLSNDLCRFNNTHISFLRPDLYMIFHGTLHERNIERFYIYNLKKRMTSYFKFSIILGQCFKISIIK